MRKFLIISILFAGLFGFQSPDSQLLERYILSFHSKQHVEEFKREVLSKRSGYLFQEVFYPLHIYLLLSTAQKQRLELELVKWKTDGLIATYKQDHELKFRSLSPNDPLYAEQWGMEKIQMNDAWEVTTGGSTAGGDRIVVAILDSGFDMGHSDLMDNLWKNTAEIPNDGADNDGNGYIDDYLGLNVDTGNDAHKKTTHGTSVAGIIGARGNNSIGISGVNWDIELMLVSGTSFESEVLEGYQYILKQKEDYLDSGGNNGAFVVATNLSAGIDNAHPEDHPLWCAIYDELGNAGILNACATTNRDADVDAVGDMPTTCPSEFLIAVTNTDKNDNKVPNAGFGEIHIDLAAPGSNTLTTDINESYNDFPGTSASAPHVTGAIALLYSVPCLPFAQAAMSQPAQTARVIRQAILQGVDTLPSLLGEVNSGGRLNIFKSMQALNIQCDVTFGDLEILTIYPNPARESIRVTYEVPDEEDYSARVYDSSGRRVAEIPVTFFAFGPKQFDINVSGYPAGVYFMTLRKGGTKTTKAFVVQ